ncbi:GapR family DNA-binding domain-containing protein, partial [Escherichia coli]
GYDTKVFRKLIAYLKKDPDDVAEQEAIFETYLAAVGRSSVSGDDSDVLG